MAYCVYVLVNPEGKTYVGQTGDLDRRVAQHNDPEFRLTLHTKRHRGPWRLLYSEKCGTRSAAMKREKQLKSGGGRRYIRELIGDGAHEPRGAESSRGGC